MDSENGLPQNNSELTQAASTNEKLELTQATSTNEKLELTQATSTNEKLELTQATSTNQKLPQATNNSELLQAASNASSSSVSSNTIITSDSEEEQKVELTKKEKLQVKFPFAFVSQENIQNISVAVHNENIITFTLNSKAMSASESDSAQPLPTVILENLDSTISRQDLALLPTKILPPLLGWETIPCETLKLHNLHINQELFETIKTCNVKRLHLFNCTVTKDNSLVLGNMEALEELDVSLPNFNDGIYIPPSLVMLKVHCPKSTVDFSNELIKYIRLGVYGLRFKHLKQV